MEAQVQGESRTTKQSEMVDMRVEEVVVAMESTPELRISTVLSRVQKDRVAALLEGRRG